MKIIAGNLLLTFVGFLNFNCKYKIVLTFKRNTTCSQNVN